MVVSAVPRLFELSDDDVDGRGSSSRTDRRTASAGYGDGSSPATSVPCETDGDPLVSIVEAEIVLGVRSWMLETACLSTVGTAKAGLVARGDEFDEFDESELAGLWNEVVVTDKEGLSLSVVASVDISLLILFCGSERGDGL